MIVLIRHAATDMAGRFCGHSDPDLNATGRDQLDRIVEQAAQMKIDRICSSDLRRARHTAEAIAQRLKIDIEFSPQLREIHFGAWEGMNWNEISAQWPNESDLWAREFPQHPAPHGETYADFAARIEAELDRLSPRQNQVTAVVTHRGVMMHVLTKLCGWDHPETWEKTAAYGAVIAVDPLHFSLLHAGIETQHCQGGSV